MENLNKEVMKKAEKYFEHGFNCAQAVALSNLEYLGGQTNGVIQLAAGFGHGMNAGCTCGALSGGVLAIGSLLADEKTKGFDKQVVKATSELQQRFINEFGSTCCRTLRKKLSLFKNTRCKHITAITAAITMEVIQRSDVNQSSSISIHSF
ncbi:MAG: C_GCAxxG_C_C family protein [Firmicutes bacterium]|nr:C_GCAxxG_C_C family protein [Bacillota bacterium]